MQSTERDTLVSFSLYAESLPPYPLYALPYARKEKLGTDNETVRFYRHFVRNRKQTFASLTSLGNKTSSFRLEKGLRTRPSENPIKTSIATFTLIFTKVSIAFCKVIVKQKRANYSLIWLIQAKITLYNFHQKERRFSVLQYLCPIMFL